MYIPGLPYHVVQRGNNREVCFLEPENYQFYLGKMHGTSKVLDLLIWRSHQICDIGPHKLPPGRDGQTPSIASGQLQKRRSEALGHGRALTLFWGSKQPGAGCLPRKGKPQCLDPEG